MSHTSTAAEIGHVLIVVGAIMIVIWTLVDVVNGWRQVRALGRRVLRVVGPLTRSPRRRRVRRDRAFYAARCARRGHRTSWDGYHEFCRRCGASSYPEVELPDPTVRPSRLKFRVDVDPRAVDKLIAEFEARRGRGGP